MKHLFRMIYMSVILLFGMVLFVYARWSGEKAGIPQVVYGEETTEAMTEKEAIKILFYYLYPDYENDVFDSLGEFVFNKDGEYYEYRTLADKENGDFHARMQIWFDGVTDDNEYYIFSVFVYYYDNISKKQERDSYHSSLISGYAVNRKNGDVMEERWQDDTGLWVYNDKFREIKQALKSNAGKMEIYEKYKGLNSNLFDSNFLNWAGRDMIEKGIYEYAAEEQEFTSVINQKSKIPKELIVLLEKAFYDSDLSKISEQDSPYFEVINKFVAEEFVIPREFEAGQKGNGKVIQYEEGFYYVSLLYNQEIEEFDGIRLCGLASDMEGEQVSIRYLPKDYVWKLVYENTLTNISYNNKHIEEYLDSIGEKLFIDEYLDNGNSDEKKIFYGEKELSSDYVLKDDCWLCKIDVGNCGLPIYVLKKYAPSYTESSQDFMVKFYINDTKDDLLIKLGHLSKDEWSGTDSLVQMWFEEIDENIYTFRMYHISDYNYLLNIALLEEDRLTMIQTYVIVPKKAFVVNESCNLAKETEENEEASTEEKEKLYAEIAMYHKVVYKGNLNYYFAIYNMDGKIVKDGNSYKEKPMIDFVNETVLRIGFQEKEGSFQWVYYDILKDEFLEQYDEGENAEDEWLVYNSVSDFREEWDLPYADKDVFEMIWSAYENVDFSGEFQEGDREMQDEYKGLFRKLLWNEEPFWDLHTGERFYLHEYNFFSGENFNPYDYKYYFFDGDGDGCPDLGVINNGMKCIFKYDRQEKKFVLWLSGGAWYHWIGTRKILSNNLRGEYDFYTVDKNGILESSVSIFSNVWGEDRRLYAAMMPDYADVSKEMKVSDEMKRQGIFCRSNGQWYFRITREEYEKLAELYLEASELVQEREKEVIYTYEELFGEE